MSDAQSHSMRYQQERLPGSLRYRNANCQHPFVFPRASSLLPPTLTLRYPPCPLLLRMVPCRYPPCSHSTIALHRSGFFRIADMDIFHTVVSRLQPWLGEMGGKRGGDGGRGGRRGGRGRGPALSSELLPFLTVSAGRKAVPTHVGDSKLMPHFPPLPSQPQALSLLTHRLCRQEGSAHPCG